MKHIEETIRELELGRQWYDQMIRGLKDFLGGRQAFERSSRLEVVGTTDGTETEIHIGNGDGGGKPPEGGTLAGKAASRVSGKPAAGDAPTPRQRVMKEEAYRELRETIHVPRDPEVETGE